jgi:hypothetical protein
MSQRIFLAALLLTTHVSIGFTQTIADVAREERLRREMIMTGGIPLESVVLPVGPEALLQEALKVSEAKRQLQQVQDAVLKSIATQKQPEDILGPEYQQIITEAFGGDRLMGIMEKSMSKTVSEKALRDMILWYRSPLGKKIGASDVEASAADASLEMQRYASVLQLNPPTSNRMRLVQQLDEQTETTARTVQMLLSVVTSMYKGLTSAGFVIPPPPPDFEKTFKAQVSESSRRAITLSMLFRYRSISDNELAGYLTFLKSPSAVAFNSSVWNGLNASLGDAAQLFGRNLAELKRNQ